jgi:hypothetical protein
LYGGCLTQATHQLLRAYSGVPALWFRGDCPVAAPPVAEGVFQTTRLLGLGLSPGKCV